MSKVTGLITKLISGEYTIKYGDGCCTCKPRGVFRYKNMTPLVGDMCEVDLSTNTILKIFPRKNELVRPACANIDKVFLIFSVVEPELNLNLLDRMLAYYEYNDVECVIIFTKLDLISDDEVLKKLDQIEKYYNKIGYRTYRSKKDLHVEEIERELDNKVCVFAGQSGSGKSTLLNLFGFNQKTDQISYALGRGKHTTRCVELLTLKNGLVADTPGFGIITLDFDCVMLSHSFKEFFELSSECKYNGCIHLNEPKCKVKEEVENGTILKSRYENYLVFINEIKERKIKY